MSRYGKTVVALFIYVVFAANAYSESGVESLSPELRALLKQEMVAIEQGMKGIIPAYVAGDYPEVAKIAGQIKNSYILKQKISKEQKQELHHKLPENFINQDKEFHQYAGRLQHVSQEKRAELVGFYYSKLLESCVNCHSAYAGHRFPGLSSPEQEPGNRH